MEQGLAFDTFVLQARSTWKTVPFGLLACVLTFGLLLSFWSICGEFRCAQGKSAFDWQMYASLSLSCTWMLHGPIKVYGILMLDTLGAQHSSPDYYQCDLML